MGFTVTIENHLRNDSEPSATICTGHPISLLLNAKVCTGHPISLLPDAKVCTGHPISLLPDAKVYTGHPMSLLPGAKVYTAYPINWLLDAKVCTAHLVNWVPSGNFGIEHLSDLEFGTKSGSEPRCGWMVIAVSDNPHLLILLAYGKQVSLFQRKASWNASSALERRRPRRLPATRGGSCLLVSFPSGPFAFSLAA
jgi:hypothetical protein